MYAQNRDSQSAVLVTDSEKRFEKFKTLDSGFLSSGSLNSSGEIFANSETFSNSDIFSNSEFFSDSSRFLTTISEKEDLDKMHIDSGVLCIVENLTHLNVKNSGLNNLSSEKIKQEVQEKSDDRDLQLRFYTEQDDEGFTDFHIALAQAYPETILSLIRSCPNSTFLDVASDNGITPLHTAVGLGLWRVARWLILAGASSCPRNRDGDSPLHIAARLGDLQCCRAIVQPVQGFERENVGIIGESHSCTTTVLNQINYEGQTPAHVAAICGRLDVLEYLAESGADINARERKGGYTLLHYAMEWQNEPLVRFLLTKCRGIDIEKRTYGGKTAFELMWPLNSTLAEFLVRRGYYLFYTNEDEDSTDEAAYEKTPKLHVPIGIKT